MRLYLVTTNFGYRYGVTGKTFAHAIEFLLAQRNGDNRRTFAETHEQLEPGVSSGTHIIQTITLWDTQDHRHDTKQAIWSFKRVGEK